MSAKQSPDKLDKRAKALRDNLRKRKSVKKTTDMQSADGDRDNKDKG